MDSFFGTCTAFLVDGVVGSGIMAQRLSNDPGLQRLHNTAAAGGVLVALILALAPASGAHFNPVVTLVDRVVEQKFAEPCARTLYRVVPTVEEVLPALGVAPPSAAPLKVAQAD